MKKYYEDMNIARGIGIFLVVLGHSFPDAKFDNNALYAYIFKFVYSFHMPLFFMISGFFAYKVYRVITTQDYLEFIGKKFKRLMVPYFVISLIACPIKIYMNKYAARPINPGSMFVNIALKPLEIPIQYFWFIYTLFLIFLLVPLFRKVPIKVMLLISLILNLVNVNITDLFYINGVIHYLFYFYLGLLFKEYYEKYEKCRWKSMAVICSLLLLIMLNFLSISGKTIYEFYSLATAVLGIIAFVNISFLIKNYKSIEIFKILGRYSYDIYLFSWFFQTGFRVIFFQMMKMNYTIVTLLMLLGGLLPVLLSKLLLKRVPIFDKLLLGNF